MTGLDKRNRQLDARDSLHRASMGLMLIAVVCAGIAVLDWYVVTPGAVGDLNWYVYAVASLAVVPLWMIASEWRTAQ